MGKIARTWSLMSASWQVLKQDKGLLSGNAAIIIACITLAVLYLIVLGLVQSALQSIFQAAVFLYARDGQVPEGFEADLLGNAMARR